jgi:hypothetical protein
LNHLAVGFGKEVKKFHLDREFDNEDIDWLRVKLAMEILTDHEDSNST